MRFLRRRHTPPAEVKPPARPAKPVALPAAKRDLTDLEDQARYHRDRAALYRARMHGSGYTSVGRLEELERASTAADERLKTARRTGT